MAKIALYSLKRSAFGELNPQTSVIRRALQDEIVGKLNNGKAILVIGPRQLRKTTP
jgi:hypothetical protein